jgi:tetratricopeptide (TPR) repeat protein
MKTTQKTACPASETVGAFVEGRLGADERAEMTQHLDQCQPCRNEVAMLAGFAASGRTERATRSGWWLVAAASLVTVVGVALFWQSGTADRDRSRVASLVAAAKPLEYRLVEGRLSGQFGWAEFRGPVRSSTEASNPKQLKLAGAAGAILDEAATDPEPEAQHAAAIASLQINDPASAVDRLAKVTAQQPENARAWSDLAAARHAAAMRFGRASEEPLALDAANRALKIDPKLPEALFNRALIVEQLGLLFEARDAWTRYLEVDPNSEWAREARARRDALPQAMDRSRFIEEQPRFEQSAVAGDARAVGRFVAQFPEDSRRTVEKETLGSWGAAFVKGDTAEAARQLAIARAVGTALRAQSREELLGAIVASIDGANAMQRARLAEGYAVYREAHAALDHNEYAEARRAFLEATRLLAGTPGALATRYLAADASNRAGRRTPPRL